MRLAAMIAALRMVALAHGIKRMNGMKTFLIAERHAIRLVAIPGLIMTPV